MDQKWLNTAKNDHEQYIDNLGSLDQIQRNLLLSIVKENCDTEYGTKFNFTSIKSIADYQENVPVITYDDIEGYIDNIISGNEDILTKEPVLLLEPTSGTTNRNKLIPYTSSLQHQYQKAINVWLYDIIMNYPSIGNSRSFWSVSPAVTSLEKSKSSVPIGFNNDYEYLGLDKKLAKEIFAVPSEMTTIRNMDNFMYLTALFLLSCENLAFISVWNPTYLSLIFEAIEKNLDSLVNDMIQGSFTLPANEELNWLYNYSIKNKRRGRLIGDILNSNQINKYELIWKNLVLISCWADSGASLFLDKISSKFRNVDIQPKGLLLTEGIISIPLVEANGSLPAYHSHFFEFQELDNPHNIKLLNEIDESNAYNVIISTGGGLYRYDTGDIVKVSGRHRNTPILEFIGRNNTIDLVGEKMSETFLFQALNNVCVEVNITVDFMLLSYEMKDNSPPNYVLLIDSAAPNKETLDIISHHLETQFSNNIYYQHARSINQLNAIRVENIAGCEMKYVKVCTDKGMKLGDIKPIVISRDSELINNIKML
jgi:hypothetical protein